MLAYKIADSFQIANIKLTMLKHLALDELNQLACEEQHRRRRRKTLNNLNGDMQKMNKGGDHHHIPGC